MTSSLSLASALHGVRSARDCLGGAHADSWSGSAAAQYAHALNRAANDVTRLAEEIASLEAARAELERLASPPSLQEVLAR